METELDRLMPAEEHRAGDTVIKDSGARRVFNSGAHRDAGEGKGFFHLLPFNGLQRIAKIFEAGSKKYTAWNWKLGMPVSTYMNSGIRHAIKAANGWTDEDHMAMACWNFLTAMETQWMVEQGQLPVDLNDLKDWLTKEGTAKAMESIRSINQQKTENSHDCENVIAQQA